MIILGQEQRLGRSAFKFFIYKKLTLGTVFIILGLVFMIFNDSFVHTLISQLVVTGMIPGQYAGLISTLMVYIAVGTVLFGVFASLVGYFMALIQYKNYTFCFNEFDLILKTGLFTKNERLIPYRQIQDVNIDRTVSHQFMKLSKLIIHTAGIEGKGEHEMSEIVLEPLDKDLAVEVRTMLQRKIGVQIVKDEAKADQDMVKDQENAVLNNSTSQPEV